MLFGKSGEGDFITNATSCPGDDTTYVTLKDTSGETTRKSFTTPIGLEGCKSLEFEADVQAANPDRAKATRRTKSPLK